MAEFLFGIGSGIRAGLSPEIILKGAFIGAGKNIIFNLSDLKKGGLNEPKISKLNFDLSGLKSDFGEESDITSYLGTPVFDPIKIVGGKYEIPNDKGGSEIVQYAGGPVEGAGFIIHNVILEVSQTKNIISTSIQGKSGTIKEYISDGDYAVTMTGIITGENRNGGIVNIGNTYPQTDVNQLLRICKVPDSIEIISDFLGLFVEKDTRWVITSYTIPQKEGFRDMQPFVISLLSDNVVELNEIE